MLCFMLDFSFSVLALDNGSVERLLALRSST